jgi:hypothetical protein
MKISSKTKKHDLPSKPCQTCGLTMVWRKKWQRVWDEVKYCSEKCRRNKGQPRQPEDKAT